MDSDEMVVVDWDEMEALHMARRVVEIVRGHVFKIVAGVHLTRADLEIDQEVNWDGSLEDYTEFLSDVRRRFLCQDAAGAGDQSTHAKLKELVRSNLDGIHLRSDFYAQVCILLFGHADLLNRFERLRFFNDRRESTRRQIREWRNLVRGDLSREISEVSEDCLSAILRLRMMPETLTHRNLEFIRKTCFSADVDVYHKRYVMLNLVMNPTSVRHHVLPSLVMKQTRFQILNRVVTAFFYQVSSMTI